MCVTKKVHVVQVLIYLNYIAVLSTFFKRVACTVRSMSEYELVFGRMFYFSANHKNSRSTKLKITESEPLPYRKNVLHIQDRRIME